MLSKEQLGTYLNKIRTERNISLREVYKKTGITYSHLSMIENGKRSVTPALLRNLSLLYHVDYLDLYEKAGYIDLIEDEKRNKITTPLSDLQQNKIHVLGRVRAGYDLLSRENILGNIFIDFNPPDLENYYALCVTGDSMEPVISDGDIIVAHKQEDFESGNTCVVLVNGDEGTIKKVIKKRMV